MNQFLEEMRELREMTPDLIRLTLVMWSAFCCMFLLFGTVEIMRISAMLSGFIALIILTLIVASSVTLSVFHSFVVTPTNKFLARKR